MAKLNLGDNFSMLSQLADEKQQVDMLLQNLVRHLTVIDSTVIGLLAALGDIPQQSPRRILLTAIGASLLFLSLLAGIYSMWRYYVTRLKIYSELERASRTNHDVGLHDQSYGYLFVPITLFCPTGLALGLLLLLAGLFVS